MARNRGWSFLDAVLNGAFSTPGEGCVDFAARDRDPARRGLSRLARRRRRAGPGRRARVPLRGHGVPPAVARSSPESPDAEARAAARRGDVPAKGARHERRHTSRQGRAHRAHHRARHAGVGGLALRRLRGAVARAGRKLRGHDRRARALHRRRRGPRVGAKRRARVARPRRSARARSRTSRRTRSICRPDATCASPRTPTPRSRCARRRRRRVSRRGCIEPAAMRRTVRGQGSNTRYVRDILPQDAPAEALLVVEVITPPGHSSSYPPHKHDTDAIPAESFARGNLLSPPRSAAGLRLPARLHRRPLARRGDDRRGPRRRHGAARLPSGDRPARLHVVLPQRDGRPAPRLAFPQRSGARVDAGAEHLR